MPWHSLIQQLLSINSVCISYNTGYVSVTNRVQTLFLKAYQSLPLSHITLRRWTAGPGQVGCSAPWYHSGTQIPSNLLPGSTNFSWLVPIPHVLITAVFKWVLKLGSISSLSLFFRAYADYSGSFASPYKLSIQSVDIHNITCWDFDGGCTVSVDQIGKNWHLD